MTDTNYTHMTMLVDRSGSMHSIADDAEGGINNLIQEQKLIDGKMTFSLIEFDDLINTVYDSVDISEAEAYRLHPRGCTALLDAAGRAINSTGEFLKALPESSRPGKVLFVIVTDGLENASREFSNEQIKKMISEQTEKYNWDFTYIGANVDAFAIGMGLGIRNNIQYAPNSGAVADMYTGMTQSVSSVRTGLTTNVSSGMDSNYE